jgi:4-amino-4-deoxy-L-arabinose transferase-like glycosyltransferase
VFRWELLGVRSLWFDEGYSLFVASLHPAEILQFLRFNDAHPAGYYLILSWWMRLVGRDLAALRVLSFAAGVTSVLLTWQLARRWVGFWGGVIAAGLVAVNPFHVYASNELRMYAPLGLVVLLAVLLLDRALREGCWPWWLGYGVCVATAAYLSYFTVLAVLPQAVWVLARREPSGLRGLLLALAVATVLYVPWMPYLPGILERNPQQWVLRPPVRGGDVLPYALSVFTSHAYGGYLPNTVTYHRGSTLVTPFLLPLLPFAASWALGVVALARGRGGQVVAVWLGGVGLVLAASVAVGREAAYPRNLVFLQPLAAVVAAAGVVEASRRLGPGAGRLAAGGLALAVLGLSLVGLQNLQSGQPEFDRYRFDRAGRFVSERLRQDDLIVYFPTGVEHAFGYYLTRPARAVSLMLPVSEWSEPEVASLARRLDPFLRETKGWVWVVTSLPGGWTRLVGPLLRRLEERGLRRADVRDFLGVQVLVYARR